MTLLLFAIFLELAIIIAIMVSTATPILNIVERIKELIENDLK